MEYELKHYYLSSHEILTYEPEKWKKQENVRKTGKMQDRLHLSYSCLAFSSIISILYIRIFGRKIGWKAGHSDQARSG